jgi:hypothetical protein
MKKDHLRIVAYAICILVVTGALPAITVGASPQLVDSKSALREIRLLSPKGNVGGFTKDVEVSWRTASGRSEKRDAQVVVSSDSGTIWVGLPNSYCLVLGDLIYGFTPLGGGMLVCRVSTNRIDVARQTNEAAAVADKIGGYLQNMNEEDITPNRKDVEIPLERIVGHSALMDLDSAEAARPPSILGAEFLGERIVIMLKSSVGKIIRLVLSRQLEPVSAQVDGETVFEKGKKAPPTIEEEFRRRQAK